MTATKPPSTPNLKRGAVVLVLFPNTNLQTAKSRPALVVQRDKLQTNLPQVVLAMVSSNLTRAKHPSRISVSLATPEGKQSGLLTDSVVMTDNLATVMLSNITRVVGSLPMTDVDRALRHTLNL